MNKQVVRFLGFAIVAIALLASCKTQHTPKPRGYYRIHFPEKNYTRFDTTYPYSFDYLKHATIYPDTTTGSEPFWVNIDYPELNGKIHISYKEVDDNLYELLEDSRKLAYKHTIKADAIKEKLFVNDDKRVMGILYDIKGNAASPIQFFATDSSTHFLRGSLYFNAIPNQDSLAPVIKFVREDIIRLMESMKWNK